MTNLEITFLQAVKGLVEQGVSVEEAKREVKVIMNLIADKW